MLSSEEREEPKSFTQYDHHVTGSYHSPLQRSHPVGFSSYGWTAALDDPAQSQPPLFDL